MLDELSEEPLDISTSMTSPAEAVLGERFWLLGSCLRGLDL